MWSDHVRRAGVLGSRQGEHARACGGRVGTLIEDAGICSMWQPVSPGSDSQCSLLSPASWALCGFLYIDFCV